MADHIDSVKDYLRLMARWRTNAAEKGEEAQTKTYDSRIACIQATVDEVEHFRHITKPVPASYGDLSDLPPSLVKELTGIKVDDLEQQLFTIIKTGGEEVDLDAILIELWRRFQIEQTRKFLQNKLWRMAQKEIIFSVSGRKGVYAASKPATAVDQLEERLSNPFTSSASTGTSSSGGWGQPSTGGFSDDLDDDIPF